MTKAILLNLSLFFLAAAPFAQAQDEFKTYVDMHVGSITRPFYSQDSIDGIKYNIWEYVNNECNNERSSEIFDKLGQIVPKLSQANFEEMVRGNVRLFCLALSPIELQFLENNTYLNDKNKRATVACITGIYGAHLLLRAKEADYFATLVRQIYYLEQHEGKPYYINSKAYSYKLIRSTADIDSVLTDPYRIGVILSIEGGHSLGHSVYINNLNDVSAAAGVDKEYQSLLRDNIARLKGVMPIAFTKGQYLNTPIFYLSIAKTYPNGLGGTALSFNRNQQTYISRPNAIGDGSTPMGKKIIEDLVSASNGGKTILIDIQHMSVDFRQQYYDQLDRFSLLGTQVPIICSHAGISGLDWNSNLYKKKDDDTKNTNEYLNHWQQNLGKKDIEKIYEYRGLIGVTLDKTVLGGTLALNRINTAVPHSNRQRNACLELFLANVFKIVQIINKKEAWDIIAIGSNFDAMQAPLDAYPSARYLRNLHSDIQTFLDNPTAIAEDATGLSLQEINRLKFGYTGIEIADKIVWRNSLVFIKKHFKDAPKK
jgi:microsomal dipeptidase-like Zn-dependent dipeptidase